jgi:putative Holliday junction resolvase
MIVAGIDFGNRRIGLAISNPDQLSAYPVETIERGRSLAVDLETLRARLTALEVRRVIVGLPLNMDGTVGPQARAAQLFARRLEEATGIPVELCDERLSSFEAEERLKGIPVRRKRRKLAIDAVAASVILETWLRSQKPRL